MRAEGAPTEPDSRHALLSPTRRPVVPSVGGLAAMGDGCAPGETEVRVGYLAGAVL
jgi:hypothetical protein